MEKADYKLLQQIGRDDPNAFRKVFDDHWESLYISAYKRLKSQALAEDIVQEVFADIWRRRKELRITGSFKSYLHTAVKYHVFKAVENMRQERDIHTVENRYLSVADGVLEFNELYRQLEVSLDKLPKRQKLVFTMSRFEGFKSSEIAAKLNLSEQTVHNSLYKTLTVLRTELKEYAPAVLLFTFLTN